MPTGGACRERVDPMIRSRVCACVCRDSLVASHWILLDPCWIWRIVRRGATNTGGENTEQRRDRFVGDPAVRSRKSWWARERNGKGRFFSRCCAWRNGERTASRRGPARRSRDDRRRIIIATRDPRTWRLRHCRARTGESPFVSD